MNREFLGYRRSNGQIGIRNYIVVISTVACSNSAAQKIAQLTNTIPITHELGCVESEEDYQRTVLSLTRAGQHSNVGGVLVVGNGCEQVSAEDVARNIASTGKPVEYVLIQEEGGMPETIAKGITLVKHIQEVVMAQKRVPCSVRDLIVAVQCGGSDWTTALSGNTTLGSMTDLIVNGGGTVFMSEVGGLPGSERILSERAVNREVALEILKMVEELRAEYKSRYGQNIEEVNPTPGNKAGGITTLVEKSMGNIKKAGTVPVQGLLKLGDSASDPGLWIIDCRVQGPDTFTLSAFAVQGAHITVFNTGRGTPAGSAIMPVIKVTGNPNTYKKLNSIIDFNAGNVIEGKKTIAEA